ncbi:ankyrin repeat domain-containing protein [Streptomyces sp. NPDC090135]|uniref:ankyrin repeat domain-containing protein n=1 Tax=Streptomyces sp. NPDC090135 TaxID=3365957 RepID=UPI00380669CB
MDASMTMADALNCKNPWTPAHQAVELSEHVTLTRILDEGADADEVCCQMTLLMHAIETEVDVANQSGEPIDSALTAILLAYGADPHLAVNGQAAYDWAHELRHDMAIRLMDRFSTRTTKLAARFRRIRRR